MVSLIVKKSQLIRTVAGYFTPNDGFQHAIVGTSEGRLHEVYFNPQKGIFQDVLGTFDDIIKIGAYFTPSDGFQHVIVATSDGGVHEVYFNPQKGVFEDTLAHFDGIVDVAGFFTPDDDFQHAIVATIDGNLHEVYFNPQKGIFQDVFAHFDGIVAIAGFFTPDDNYRHVIVATIDGNLHEVYFNPQKGIFQDVLTHFDGIGQIGAYFTPTDSNRHVIVGTNDGKLHEVYFNPQRGIFQDVLTTFATLSPTVEDVSPNTPNGTPGGGDSTAGVIIGLDGNEAAVYALSLNAGVWKSVANAPWTQLAGSPGDGCCIAMDPNNSSHIVVGERDGDAVPLSLNHSGVWESYDAGNTWAYTFNPLSLQGNTSQAVPAVAFSPKSTLFIGTRHGIGRKAVNASTFDFTQTPASVDFVTAFAMSQSNDVLLEEHVAGISSTEDVLIFYWSPRHDWQTLNVTQITGQKIANPLTSWQTPDGPYTVEHLAGMSPSGDVFVFYSSQRQEWTTVNVSQITGQKIASPLTSWQTPDGPFNVEHLAGMSPNGDVLVFYWSPQHDWQVVNVSQITGQKIASPLTSWQTPKRLQMVWARTPHKLLMSQDDGRTWTVRDIRTTITIPQTVIGTTTVPAGTYNIVTDNIGLVGGNDYLSLAAVDSMALLSFKLLDTTNMDPTGNHNTLLIHDFSANTWQVQFLDTGDGRGLGGRRFVKSYILDRPDLPFQVGARLQLFTCGADDVLRALGANSDGTIQWDSKFALTSDGIHTDFWNFHIAPDGGMAWITCDGGINQKSLPSGQWVTRDDGLHTHHAHTLTVLLTNNVSRSKLVYPTADNDAWFRDTTALVLPPASWQHESVLGDVNWSAGDAGNPALALVVRRPADGQGVMTAFGDPPPNGANVHEGQKITLNNDETFDGPLFLQFIQTLQSESSTFPLLDAVMLANLPLKDSSGNPVPGTLGQPNPGGNPVLIRTRAFAQSPDANASKFQTWHIETNNLPQGTRGFWVSGGHENPTYYLYAAQAGGLVLYKQIASDGSWKPLDVSGLLDGGTYGPAFINPYNPNHLFVLTNAGIKVSTDGGNSFPDEVILTALVTNSGKFPLVGNFSPDPKFIAVGNRGHSNSMGTLSHMAFSRNNPNEVVAASAFTGVFYTNGDGSWRTLSPYLPHPLSPVASVAIDSDAVYAAMEGRSVVGIVGYCNAPLASYFQIEQVAKPAGLLTTLRDAERAIIANASVHMHIATLDGTVLLDAPVNTNASGQLFLPTGLQPGSHSIELHFAGSTTISASEAAFIY